MHEYIHLVMGFLGALTAYMAIQLLYGMDRRGMRLDRNPDRRKQEISYLLYGTGFLFIGFFTEAVGGWYHNDFVSDLGAATLLGFVILLAWMIHRWLGDLG